jgi:H+/Cl- antiporter ClcA
VHKTSVKEILRFIFMAFFIGLFSVIFATSCEFAFHHFLAMFHYFHFWMILIIPCAFFIISYLITNYFPEAQGSGIPHILAIYKAKNINVLSKYFILRLILTKYIFVVLGTLFGATIGREGPTVQIGSTIMILGNKNPSPKYQKFLLTIGAAAGLAAAFNTPIGGIVFAFEELTKKISHKFILIKVSGIAIAGITTMLFVGNFSYFGRVGRELLNYTWQIFPISFIIGILAAIFCYLFTQCVYYVTLSQTSIINIWRQKHIYSSSIICGVILAVVGILSAGLSFGNGYIETTKALANQMVLPNYYFIYKMISSLVSTASAVPGGYFATSLAIGNGIGTFVHSIYSIANIQQYGIIGMVAFLAALTRAPITSIIMVLQVTSSQIFTLPIILAALVSCWLSQLLGKSIYEHQVNRLLDVPNQTKD